MRVPCICLAVLLSKGFLYLLLAWNAVAIPELDALHGLNVFEGLLSVRQPLFSVAS